MFKKYTDLIDSLKASHSSFYLPNIGTFYLFNSSTSAPLDKGLPLRACKSLVSSTKHISLGDFAGTVSASQKYLLLGGSTASGLYTTGLECFLGDCLSHSHHLPTHTLALPSHNLLQQLLLLFSLSSSIPELRRCNLIFYLGYNEISQSLPLNRLGFFPATNEAFFHTHMSKYDLDQYYQEWFSRLKRNNQLGKTIRLQPEALRQWIENCWVHFSDFSRAASIKLGLSTSKSEFYGKILYHIKGQLKQYSPYELILKSLDDGENLYWLLNDLDSHILADARLSLKRLLDVARPLLNDWCSGSGRPIAKIFLQRPFLYSLPDRTLYDQSIAVGISKAVEISKPSSPYQVLRQILIYRYTENMYTLVEESFKSSDWISVYTGQDSKGFEFSSSPLTDYIDHCHLTEEGFQDLARAIAISK